MQLTYLLIATDRDFLDFLGHYYHSQKTIFSKVITILLLKRLLSSDKIAFNIIQLKSILQSLPGNIFVIVLKAVLKLGTQIKSLIVSVNKAASNIIKLKLISELPSSNMPTIAIKAIIELDAQIKSLRYQKIRQVIYSYISQIVNRFETQYQASKYTKILYR